MERVAIAGAGIAGAYLYRLLANRGVRPDVFDRRSGTRCGLRPCAWGTSRGFEELVKAAGLEPDAYLRSRVPYVMMDEFRIPADLITFDKPRLVTDLLGAVEVRYDQVAVEAYDRVVDATGIARAYLPGLGTDLVLPCVQSRIQTTADLENRIRVGGVGYAWCFPVGQGGHHIGCGSLLYEPQERVDELGWIAAAGGEVACSCASRIRVTGPHESRPFVARVGNTEVWGVGEAIGCVAPLAGDGVVTGMKSAAIALDCWSDPDRYAAQILKEFGWMRSERRVLDKLLKNRRLSAVDALVLRRNSRRMGMEVSLRQAFCLMERLGSRSPARPAWRATS
jgi:flavin-dependent dehydrogenase